MTTAYTSLLGMALPVTGELSGTWGDTVNNYITSYVDAAVEGTQTISGSQTAVTLSTTTGTSLSQVGSGSTGSAQYAVINCTGNPASLLTVTVPASSRQYVVINATSTSQSVKIVGVGPTTGVTITSGEKAIVAWNGSDFVKVATSTAGSGSVTSVAAGTGMSFATITSSGSVAIDTTVVPRFASAGTFTATQTFNGTSSTKATQLLNAAETVNVVASAPSSTTNFYVNSGAVQYYTTDAANNWTLNVAFSSGTSLNTAMAVGDSITIALLAKQGSTAYYQSALTIDGSSVTPLYQGGTAWTSGNASGVDAYVLTVIKTASATYTVIASQTQYK